MSKQYDGFFRIISLSATTAAGLFILFRDWGFVGDHYMLIGLLLALGGCLMAGSPKKSWGLIFAMIVAGFYCMARATGSLGHQYFKYGVGIALLVFAGVQLYQLLGDRTDDDNTRSD